MPKPRPGTTLLRSRTGSRVCARRWCPSPLGDAGLPGRRQARGSGRLVTGGDSGIGRAVAIGFAKEGADIAIVYLDEHEDAESTKALVEEQGRRCRDRGRYR